MPVTSLTQIKLPLSDAANTNQAEVRPRFQAWFRLGDKIYLQSA
jgi:hypothetical protein